MKWVMATIVAVSAAVALTVSVASSVLLTGPESGQRAVNVNSPLISPSVPRVMSLQGRLTHPDGTPYPAGSQTVAFSIWDAPTGGTQLWTETDNLTLDPNGFFDTLLGSVNALPPTLGDPAYVQMEVGSETLLPRIRIAASAFALVAEDLIAPGPNPYVDVRAYGAKGDGITDDTAAIEAAMDALPSGCPSTPTPTPAPSPTPVSPCGGIVFFPPGVYLTTGITIADKPVKLVGSGGTCEIPPPDYRRLRLPCPTTIKSITNAPIVKFTVTDRAATQVLTRDEVGLRDLAIQGNGCGSPEVGGCLAENVLAFNDQHCLQVDNFGFVAYDISLAQCGGHGLYLTASDDSRFYNVRIAFANGDGINGDNTLTVASGQTENGTEIFGGEITFSGSASTNCGWPAVPTRCGDGMRILGGGHGISTWGLKLYHNYNYGIDLMGSPGYDTARFSRFMSTWDEQNQRGSVHFSNKAYDNLVDYVRNSSGPPVYDDPVHPTRNLVWGSDVTQVETGTATGVTATTMTDCQPNNSPPCSNAALPGGAAFPRGVFSGFAVVLGDRRAVIAFNDTNTLYLDSDGWRNADGTPSAAPPQLGMYQIANQSACSATTGCVAGNQLLKLQLGMIVTGGDDAGGDINMLHVRNHDDTGDGDVSVGKIFMRSPGGHCFYFTVDDVGNLSPHEWYSPNTIGSESCAAAP